MATTTICESCGFGSHKQECVKCGTAVPSRPALAQLCPDCFQSRKDKCIKCGKAVPPEKGVAAVLCWRCASDAGQEKCIRCGKYLNRKTSVAS